MRLLKYFSIIALIAAIAVYIKQGQPQYRTFQGQIFGTSYLIKIRTNKKDNSLHDKIIAELENVNNSMSVFKPDSEISQINKTPANVKIELSPNMSYLLRQAHHINQQTNGAFDPTVGPLVELWGFGTTKDSKIPTNKEIQQVRNFVGFKHLVFSSDYSFITKKDRRTTLNLSAIAKGYGVDQVAALLEKEGYKNYIVEIGGELRIKGFRDESGTAWTVGVKEPKMDGSNIIALELSNIAVATSGDYQNFRHNTEGKTFSHIISPQTGHPTQSDLASVTVFADLCLDADAYATALMTMNYAEALTFADQHNLKVIFFRHADDETFVKSYSLAAQKLLGE